MDEDSRVILATEKVSSFEYDVAEKLYCEYLNTKGDDYHVWMDLGLLRLKMEDLTGACDALGNAFDIHPENIEAAVAYGDVLMILHRYEEAKAVFEYAAKIDSTSIPVQVRITDALIGQNHLTEAYQQLGHLASVYPNDPMIQNRIRHVALKLGYHSEADTALEKECELRKMIAESSNGAAEWLEYGKVLEDALRYSEAEQAYTASLVVENSAYGQVCLGLVQIRLGNTDNGRKNLLHGIDKEPRNLALVLEIADVLTELGRYDDAVGYYTKALELSSVRADTWASCAYALYKMGKREEAQAFFEMAKASVSVRELKWAYKLHNSEKTAVLAREFS